MIERERLHPFKSPANPPSLREPSPLLSLALREAFQRLNECSNNHLKIGTPISFPKIKMGHDFEIRTILQASTRFATEEFQSLLPKQWHRDRRWWGAYVQTLSREFCDAFQSSACSVRFAQISGDLCKLFHCDNVHLRLIQTLRGPGTEYLLNDNVNRKGLGQGCNDRIVLDASQIQRASEGDILLMRGELWSPSQGLVHRSPAIEKSGLRRIYLCLDTVMTDGGQRVL